VLKAVFLTADN